ncbi:MAG: HepT-like ribonuclease domain-containing protein [Pseudomonadota bacterium]
MLILELGDHLDRRLSGITEDAFVSDRDEVDLTSYRLAMIGEESRRLSAALKADIPHIPWRMVTALRNVLVHDYEAIVPVRLWATYQDELPVLMDACRTALDAPA